MASAAWLVAALLLALVAALMLAVGRGAAAGAAARSALRCAPAGGRSHNAGGSSRVRRALCRVSGSPHGAHGAHRTGALLPSSAAAPACAAGARGMPGCPAQFHALRLLMRLLAGRLAAHAARGTDNLHRHRPAAGDALAASASASTQPTSRPLAMRPMAGASCRRRAAESWSEPAALLHADQLYTERNNW